MHAAVEAFDIGAEDVGEETNVDDVQTQKENSKPECDKYGGDSFHDSTDSFSRSSQLETAHEQQDEVRRKRDFLLLNSKGVDHSSKFRTEGMELP